MFFLAVLTLGGSVPPGFWFLLAERFPGLFVSALEGGSAGFIFPFALPKSRQKSFKIAGASQIKVKTHSSHPNAKQLGRE